MDKVGVSGNADQHYDKDWLNVEIEASLDRFGEIASSPEKESCKFPSVRVVEVFYKRINTDKEPQYLIMKLQHYSRQDV
jgi:hypothetical protein